MMRKGNIVFLAGIVGLMLSGCKQSEKSLDEKQVYSNDVVETVAEVDTDQEKIETEKESLNTDDASAITFEEEVSRLEAELGHPTTNPNDYADLNNDGIPEVFINYGEPDLNYEVYTLYDGEWNYVISDQGEYGSISNIEGSPYFEYGSDSGAGCYVYICTIEAGELIEKAYIGISNFEAYYYPSEEAGYADELEYSCTISEKDASPEEFWSYVESILPIEEVSNIKETMSF